MSTEAQPPLLALPHLSRDNHGRASPPTNFDTRYSKPFLPFENIARGHTSSCPRALHPSAGPHPRGRRSHLRAPVGRAHRVRSIRASGGPRPALYTAGFTVYMVATIESYSVKPGGRTEAARVCGVHPRVVLDHAGRVARHAEVDVGVGRERARRRLVPGGDLRGLDRPVVAPGVGLYPIATSQHSSIAL